MDQFCLTKLGVHRFEGVSGALSTKNPGRFFLPKTFNSNNCSTYVNSVFSFKF